MQGLQELVWQKQGQNLEPIKPVIECFCEWGTWVLGSFSVVDPFVKKTHVQIKPPLYIGITWKDVKITDVWIPPPKILTLLIWGAAWTQVFLKALQLFECTTKTESSGIKEVFPLPSPSTKSLNKQDSVKFLHLEEAKAVPSIIKWEQQERPVELSSHRKKSYIPMT